MFDRFQTGLEPALGALSAGLVWNILQYATQRACAVQCSLGSAQHLDTRQVEGVKIS